MSYGTKDALSALRPSGSQAAGTETGDEFDLGPLGGVVKGVANLTTVGSSATHTLKIQGSATSGGTFYDIPGALFADPADGAAMDAVGLYEVQFKTAFRYLRSHSVVATAAITWECFLTKEP